MFSRRARLACLLVAATGCATEQTASPVAPGNSACRTIAALSTQSTEIRAAGASYNQEAEVTCQYDRGGNRLICATQTIVPGGRALEVTRWIYGSIADFIEEGRSVPARPYAVRYEADDSRGVLSVSIDRVFDSSRRLARETSNYTPVA